MLWSLLEKKFRAIGEFVEGQEKMKIVVQKTYESKEILEKEYFATDRGGSDEDDDENDDDRKVAGNTDDENDQDGKDLVNFESQLGREIDELEQEEMDLLKAAEEEDGDVMDGRDVFDGPNRDSATNKVGSSEDQAIDLDDLDVEDKDSKQPATSSEEGTSQYATMKFDHRSPDAFAGCRYYAQTYSNPYGRFNLELMPWDGRIIVARNQHRIQTKPEPGDILVAVNNVHVPYPCPSLKVVTDFLAKEIAKGPVQLWMVDGGEEWKELFARVQVVFNEKRMKQLQYQQQFERDRAIFQQQRQQQQEPQNPGKTDGATIELLDDSDDE